MNHPSLKYPLLVALIVLSFGLISRAQAQQVQTTSYNGDSYSTFTGGWDYETSDFTDTYDPATGLHSGTIRWGQWFHTEGGVSPGTGLCDSVDNTYGISSFTIYDVNGNVIANISTSTYVGGPHNADGFSYSGRPGASVGRVVVTDQGFNSGTFNDGNGGCSNYSYPINPTEVVNCDSTCFDQTPLINSFSGTSPICPGATSTLNWTSSGATSASINGSPVPVSGSLSVSPSTTTTYTLTVANATSSANSSFTVTVLPQTTITGYSASATTVNVGQSTTLSYTTSGGTSATITDLTSGAVTAVAVPNGSLVVTPPTSRTYRLTLSGTCGTVTQDIAITVNQPPSISTFTASASSICATQSTTLSWTSSGGSSASITDLTSGVVTPVAVSGSLAVTPPSTRTYRLTVTNGAGSVTSDLTITVTPLAAINSYSASSATVNAGQSTNLSFNVSNTTARSITDLTSGVVTPLASEIGVLSVTPATTRTFRLTASNGCNTITQDVTITVIQPPIISTFTSNVGSVCSGGPATLSWSASGGTSASISAPGLPGSPVAVNPNSGSLVVNPTSTTTYTLTVANGAGSVTSTVTVSVTPAPVIGSLTASATTINAGQSTTLSFTSSNGSSASITDLTSGTVTAVPVNGSLVVTPATSRSYRFTVSGTCGTVTQDVAITVVQPPTISSYTASASPICAGQSTTLSWASSGGTSASVADLTSGTVTAVAVNGTLAVTPPTSRTYRLTVANGAGSVTSDLPITVNPLAVINSFSASATSINAGQSTTLSFNVSNTTARSITDLSTGTVTNLATESGTQVVTPATTRTYRLTASNGCNTVTQDVTINVTQSPVISTFTASASPVCSGGASTLSWTAAGGTSATISAPGLPGSPVAVNPNSGSLVVNPASTTTYTLTVTNGAGSVTSTVTVAVTPAPAIASFTATPSTVVAGNNSTLAWTSSNGTSATITDLTSGTITSVPVNGSLVVTPASTRNYRLTINGSCGTITQTLTVTVTPCQTISSYTASASTVTQGQSTTLSYTLTGATSATITDLTSGTVTSVPVQTGSLVVTPATTRAYRLTVVGPCATITRDLTITVNAQPGIPLIGPSGQPNAVGPTDNNDDYTNMTATVGVSAPFGGQTTAGGVVTFTNTALNNGPAAENMILTARSIPAGFTVDCSSDNGATWINLNTSSLTGVAPAGATYTLLIRVTYPAGLNVLTGYNVILRLANVNTPTTYNETIDRLWTGFVRADKTYTVTNGTGVGGPTDVVSGAVIEYTLTYTNVTASSGTGNLNLTATNVVLTEDGFAAPNTWGATTNHVPGSASDTLGGVITGDVAGSSLIRNTVPSLAPGQTGILKFRRVIK